MTRPTTSAKPAASEVPSRYRVQVLDRSFAILDALSAVDAELSPGDLANRLRLHKSTVHRLLVVLEASQFVRRTPQGKYGLGMKLIEMGSRAKEHLDLGRRSVPFLQQVMAETGETVHISALSGTEMVSIANVRGRWTLSIPSTVGRRTSVHCTAGGKAFVAFLPDSKQRELISRLKLVRRTRRTIVSIVALRAELGRIKRRGYAIDDEEAEVGLRCIGVPVRNHKGEVVAAISVAGPVFRVRKGRLSAIARSAIRAANDLSADLGFEKADARHTKAAAVS